MKHYLIVEKEERVEHGEQLRGEGEGQGDCTTIKQLSKPRQRAGEDRIHQKIKFQGEQVAAMKINFMKLHAQYVVWGHHATKIFIFVV